jgi:hypothetical protein
VYLIGKYFCLYQTNYKVPNKRLGQRVVVLRQHFWKAGSLLPGARAAKQEGGWRMESSSGNGDQNGLGAHTIETILRQTGTQFFLRRLTRKRAGEQCFLEEVFAAYKNRELPWRTRGKFFFPFLFIDFFCRLATAQKEEVIRELFDYPPRARALVNTARSIGTYGLTKPQIFYAPLMVVWNFTQACNLKCKHC